MSAFYSAADSISAMLSAVDALSGVTFVVDRQKDIASELRKAMAKQGGCLALVTWAGAPNEDSSSDGPRFVSRYTVTLFSKPIIRAGETAADDLIEAMATALHDYRLSPDGSFHDRLIVTGIDPVPSDELLIYRVNLTTPTQL